MSTYNLNQECRDGSIFEKPVNVIHYIGARIQKSTHMTIPVGAV